MIDLKCKVFIYSKYESGIAILKSLKIQGFSNIDIHQIIYYLETLDYDLQKTKYIDKIL